MNWYSFLKFAQIWDVDFDPNDLESMIEAMYELEYKYSMVKNYSTDHNKRLENIKNKLSKNLNDILYELTKALDHIVSKWIDSHDLEHPEKWAEARSKQLLEEFGPIQAFYVVQREYERFAKKPSKILIEEIVDNLEQFDSLKNYLQEIVQDEKNFLIDEMEDESVEETNNRFNTNFSSKEEAQKYIENLQIYDTFLLDQIKETIKETDSIDKILEYGDPQEILAKIHQYIILPHFAQKFPGLEDLVEQAKKTLYQLRQATNTNEEIRAVHNVLRLEHMYGNLIVDHADEEGYGEISHNLLTSLTQGEKVEQWNKELREIGIKI